MMRPRILLAASLTVVLTVGVLFLRWQTGYDLPSSSLAADPSTPVLFEDFSGGIGSWSTSGNVTAQQQSGNGVMRLTTPANGAVEASRSTTSLSLAPYQSV